MKQPAASSVGAVLEFAVLGSAVLGLSMSLALPSPAISSQEREAIARECRRLEDRIGQTAGTMPDLLADMGIFVKGVQWALRYETALDANGASLIKKALRRARERLSAVEAGRPAWPARKGRVVRGFVSAMDGSVQPYGLIVPRNYHPVRPMRLDVVLHGSTKPRGLNELHFMSRFDEGDEPVDTVAEQDYLELHPMGRVENGYRWAGETDVFEAIDAVARNYKVDCDRIVLRGMSMGASGTWHLGLKHPDRFVALGPYCGYVDTYHFSRTPLPTFVKVDSLPAHQNKTLHMLDSIDYAANAGVVPAIACMGEKDVFFQAHVLMRQAMEKEGLKMVNLISPGTGHVLDPATHKQQFERIGEIAAKGLDRKPRHLRFVTWTLKYGRCHWLQVLGLVEHYCRAELDARIAEDGTIDVKEPKNITRFAILPPAWQGGKARLRVEGTEVVLPTSEGASLRAVLERRDGKWAYVGNPDSLSRSGKRPGPIDDAFTSPFLCVRGTGKAWNSAIAAYAEASLQRFAYEWHRYFLGQLPIKDDKAVTKEDIRRCNLILFGDPGSNALIRRVLPKMPIKWTREELRFGQQRHAAVDHVPLLIQPSPLAEDRYVVFNSGHTFRERELASLNYLLFPRLADWAVLKVGSRVRANPAEPLDETVVNTGFFDEQWRRR